MLTLKDAFHTLVGYSDHTLGNDVAIAAVTLGASVIEKHFTLDRTMDGPDHAASTSPNEFAEFVKAIRNTELLLGNGIKEPTNAEREISKVVTKRIVAMKNINVGDLLTTDNLCVKRNDTGEKADMWDKVVGIRAKKNYQVDEGILL